MEIVFLSREELLDIHRDQIERYGGSHGIRDPGLLDAAMAMPESGFGEKYLHADIFEMAAAYLYHLTQNHPFVDGNKRVGAMAAYTFLHLNGYDLDESLEDDLEALVLSIASGKSGKPEASIFLKNHATRRP